MSGDSVTARMGRLSVDRILDDEHRFHLAVVLTFLLLLMYSHRYWYVNIPLSIIALSGLIIPAIGKSRILWFAVVAIIAIASAENWYALDNHKYLLGYWCFAIFCCLFATDAERSLALTARYLIGLVFILGVAQKTLSDNYLDGAFMHYELLLDERFHGLARYVGGIPDHMQDLNMAARRALVNFESGLTSVQLMSTDNAARVASFVTWWNYVIQVIVALAFLVPGFDWLYKRRDFWLLVFLFTTYLFAPVIGFGWVLAIMGVMQTGSDQMRIRMLYVFAFLFLQVYRLPWSEITSLLSTYVS